MISPLLLAGFLLFSKCVCGELLSDGAFLTPGGNFLMPGVVGLGRNIFERGKAPHKHSGSPSKLHFLA